MFKLPDTFSWSSLISVSVCANRRASSFFFFYQGAAKIPHCSADSHSDSYSDNCQSCERTHSEIHGCVLYTTVTTNKRHERLVWGFPNKTAEEQQELACFSAATLPLGVTLKAESQMCVSSFPKNETSAGIVDCTGKIEVNGFKKRAVVLSLLYSRIVLKYKCTVYIYKIWFWEGDTVWNPLLLSKKKAEWNTSATEFHSHGHNFTISFNIIIVSITVLTSPRPPRHFHLPPEKSRESAAKAWFALLPSNPFKILF